MAIQRLWFDVGIKRYTTFRPYQYGRLWLWFDVGIKRYTTFRCTVKDGTELWFDVGIKRYTTLQDRNKCSRSCGLM